MNCPETESLLVPIFAQTKMSTAIEAFFHLLYWNRSCTQKQILKCNIVNTRKALFDMQTNCVVSLQEYDCSRKSIEQVDFKTKPIYSSGQTFIIADTFVQMILCIKGVYENDKRFSGQKLILFTNKALPKSIKTSPLQIFLL